MFVGELQEFGWCLWAAAEVMVDIVRVEPAYRGSGVECLRCCVSAGMPLGCLLMVRF